MSWLHTWTGLLVGWVLYFMFVTGTFGYINAEVTRWMQPERPLASASAPPQREMVAFAEKRLKAIAEGADYWSIGLPGSRWSSDLSVEAGWRSPKEGEEGKEIREVLDPSTGEVSKAPKARDTAGGGTLYEMHFQLYYMPEDWGNYIVGICTMFMLVAIVSGIIVHKKIFKDFFTFRPGKGQRSWLDGHNILSVTALPFHIMITWSGLLFFMVMYMPVAFNVLFPDGPKRDAYWHEIWGRDEADKTTTAGTAPLIPLLPLFDRAERAWGPNSIGFISIEHPGRANARIQVEGPSHEFGEERWTEFDGVTGKALRGDSALSETPMAEKYPPSARFTRVLFKLHVGGFAGPLLRFLYVVTGFVATGMIGTGLLLWSNKRKARLRQSERPDFGIRVVDVLNLGTIVGLPIGVAAFFWSNRLIPAQFEAREEWEMHALFITWGLTFLYALVRSHERAWVELYWIAATLWGSLPILNGLTTERHLGVTIPARDWALVSLDLGMLGAGLLFAFFARTIRRKQKAVSERGPRSRRPATPPISRGAAHGHIRGSEEMAG